MRIEGVIADDRVAGYGASAITPLADAGAGPSTPPRPARQVPVSPSFRAANGWRGPGAIAIALAHLALATDLLSESDLQPVAFVVDLFFVLSGLVIAQAYSAKLSRASAIPEYLIRRIGRIWPVQVATLAILVLYELGKLVVSLAFGKAFSSPPFSLDGLDIVQAIPTNLLLIQSLGLHDRETWNFPSWSLSVEFVTYVSFAAFCLAPTMWRRVLTVATIAVSLLILAFVAPLHMRSTFDFGVFRCLAGFFAGTLCYEVAARWRLPRWPFPTLVEIAAVALMGLWLTLTAGTVAGYGIGFAVCLFILVFSAERGLVSRILCSKPLQFLAELSFSLYMVHALVLVATLAGLHVYARATGQSLFHTVENPFLLQRGSRAIVEVFQTNNVLLEMMIVAVFILGVFAASIAIYYVVEVPGRKAFGRLAKRVSTAPQRRPNLAAAGPLERS